MCNCYFSVLLKCSIHHLICPHLCTQEPSNKTRIFILYVEIHVFRHQVFSEHLIYFQAKVKNAINYAEYAKPRPQSIWVNKIMREDWFASSSTNSLDQWAHFERHNYLDQNTCMENEMGKNKQFLARESWFVIRKVVMNKRQQKLQSIVMLKKKRQEMKQKNRLFWHKHFNRGTKTQSIHFENAGNCQLSANTCPAFGGQKMFWFLPLSQLLLWMS